MAFLLEFVSLNTHTQKYDLRRCWHSVLGMAPYTEAVLYILRHGPLQFLLAQIRDEPRHHVVPKTWMAEQSCSWWLPLFQVVDESF